MIGTKYQKSRRTISDYPYSVIKRPKSDNKLGRRVTVGRFKGYAMYSLTLEERATCPKTCQRWADCYGNNMPFAHRLQHGLDLDHALFRDVGAACRDHPQGCLSGFVLGDFYSPEYVGVWEELLATHDNLAAWIHAPERSGLRPSALERCKIFKSLAIRHSDRPRPLSALHESIAPPKITCPEQIGKTKSCELAGCAGRLIAKLDSCTTDQITS